MTKLNKQKFLARNCHNELKLKNNKKNDSHIVSIFSSKKSSFEFQPGRKSSFKEDEINHKLNWRRLQLSRSKLKQTAKTSALFAGFAMVAMVEVSFNNDPENPVPSHLLILFGICTVLLVSIHILALMIATCILPSVESIALLGNIESAADSPHERLRFFIELAWTFSSVIGVFLFLIEVIILCWVKFWEMGQPFGQPGKAAALASTIVFIPFVLIFMFFAFYFYRDFVKNKYEKSTKEIEELEDIIVKLSNADMNYCEKKSCKKNLKDSLLDSNFNKFDHSKILLKKFYDTNDHLLAKNLSDLKKNNKVQSASVDHIYKNDYLYKLKLNNFEKQNECFSLNNINFDIRQEETNQKIN